MAHVLIRHKVNDYRQWRDAFDEFIPTRQAGGEKSFRLFTVDDDPNNLQLLFEWDNRKNAERFLQSKDLQEAMKTAGVVEQPEITYLGCVENC
jgi:quinol monooxygenase YgiN